MKRWFFVGLAVVLVALAFYPMQGTGYGIRTMLQLFMWIALAQSWNLISGLTGYVSFGHVAFFGMGAYTTGILITRLALPWPLAALAGGVMAMVLALVIGWPCLRLKGPYFAIAMLGLNEVLRVIVSYYEGLTGGGNGLSLPTLHASVPIYYAMGLVALAITGLTYRIITSRFGLRLMTIREDEVAAEAMGIDTTKTKLLAFGLGATWAGFAGTFFAAKQSFISPESFTFFESVIILSMVVLGGMGSIPGVILGAAALVVLPEITREFALYRTLIFGFAMVAMMVLRPQGFVGSARRAVELRGGDEPPAVKAEAAAEPSLYEAQQR